MVAIAERLSFEEIRSPLEFSDISEELYREYVYLDGSRYRIDDPLGLHVSESRGHKIVDAFGMSFYVRCGWIVIEFQVDGDRDHWRF